MQKLPYIKLKKDYLKRNHIQFRYGIERDIVTFVYKPQFIQVHIGRQKTCDTKRLHKVCLEIRNLVKDTLRKVTASMLHSLYTVASQEQYRYDFEPYQFAFNYHDPSDKEHFCVVYNKEEDPKYMDCVRHESCGSFEMEQRHLFWYGKVSFSVFLLYFSCFFVIKLLIVCSVCLFFIPGVLSSRAIFQRR